MIKQHGHWSIYKSAEPQPVLPGSLSIVYCRRDEDGIDWYEFQKTVTSDNVWMTVMLLNDYWMTQAVTRDISMLFPAHALLIEVSDIEDADPFATYNHREFFPEQNTFGEIIEFAPPLDANARIDRAIEAAYEALPTPDMTRRMSEEQLQEYVSGLSNALRAMVMGLRAIQPRENDRA